MDSIIKQINQDLEKPILKVINDKKVNTSIIIPFRSNPKLFRKTIKNLEKTKGVFEVVVVDDDSGCQILDFLKTTNLTFSYLLYKRSEYISEFPIRRAGQIRNKGVQYSKGKILIFLDSDILVDEDFVKLHEKNHTEKNIVLLGTRSEDNRISIFKLFPDINKMPNPWKMLHSHNFSVNRDLFERVGGFSDYFFYWGGEDEELGYKLFKNRAIFKVEEKLLAIHQFHKPEWISSIRKKMATNINYRKFYEKYNDPDIKKSFNFDTNRFYLKLFDKCNNNCIFCNSFNKKGKFKTFEEIKMELDDSKKYNANLRIGGGEFTLHPDFDKILHYIKKNKMNIELATNARIFNYTSFSRKVSDVINNFYIYVYAWDDGKYHKITNVKESFKQVRNGIQTLFDLKNDLKFHMIISKYTIEDIEKIYQELKKYTTGKIRLSYIPTDKKEFEKDLETIKSFSSGKDILLKDPFFKCFKKPKNIRQCLVCNAKEYCLE
jgi:organic radical activating enzyme